MKFTVTFILICVLLCPIKVSAEESDAKFFSVNCDIGNHTCIAPDDYFSETFTIKNHTSEAVKIRVSRITNIENSRLYDALQAGWVDSNGSYTLRSLESLTTDWHLLEPKEALKLNLKVYFPGNLGNEYQGTQLKAQFTFECRVSQNEHIQIESESNSGHYSITSIPSTSDEAPVYALIILCIFSAFSVLILSLSGKYKRPNNRHDEK